MLTSCTVKKGELWGEEIITNNKMKKCGQPQSSQITKTAPPYSKPGIANIYTRDDK